jgi:hypothetical protein
MIRKRVMLLALALVLAGAGACSDSTAPSTIPDEPEDPKKIPPKTGFLILPGEGGALLV